MLLVDLGLAVTNPLALPLGGRLPDLIHLDGEGNIPAWWSSAKLLLTGLLFALVAARSRALDRAVRLLGLMALAFIAMSLDEASGLHERAGEVVDRVPGDRAGTTFHRTGLWVFALGIPVGLAMTRVLLRLARFLDQVPGTCRRLFLGLALLLGGAMVVEATSNFVFPEGAVEAGVRRPVDLARICLEEGLEMAGGSVPLWASLIFAGRHWSTRAACDLLATPLRRGDMPPAGQPLT